MRERREVHRGKETLLADFRKDAVREVNQGKKRTRGAQMWMKEGRQRKASSEKKTNFPLKKVAPDRRDSGENVNSCVLIRKGDTKKTSAEKRKVKWHHGAEVVDHGR